MELKQQSGSGRITDLILPPINLLTLAEYYDIRSIAIDKASARSASGSADVIYIADRNIIRKFDLGNNLVYFITGSNSEYTQLMVP